MILEEKVKLMDVALRACKVTTNEKEIKLMLSISNALDTNENLSLKDVIAIYLDVYPPFKPQPAPPR